jgi:hypothetical protein
LPDVERGAVFLDEIDPLFPVWTIASDDEMLPAVQAAAARVRETGATIVASGTAAKQLAGADYVLAVPKPPAPLLSRILSVVPGQLFAGRSRARKVSIRTAPPASARSRWRSEADNGTLQQSVAKS